MKMATPRKGKNRQSEAKNTEEDSSEEEPTSDFGELALVGSASVVAGGKENGWWIDPGASHHFTCFQSDFRGELKPPEVTTVRVGDGRKIPAKGMGNVTVKGTGGKLVTLTKVHFVPSLHTRLLSGSHLTSRGFDLVFSGRHCKVSKQGVEYMCGEKTAGENSLVQMQLEIVKTGKTGDAAAATKN
jgi:hypothetical protein